MFERLKAVFGANKSTADVPGNVWAVTVLLNPGGSKNTTPREMVEFAKRHADELGERTHALYFGGIDDEKTVAFFTLQESACEYIVELCEQRIREGEDAGNSAFGLVLLHRRLLYGALERVQNLRIMLDPWLAGEREVTIADLSRYANH